MESKVVPEWVNTLFDQITSQIEFKGMADIAWRHFEPNGTGWGVDVLEIAPALMDLSQFGSKQGEVGYGIIHNLDLMEVQQTFQEVTSLSFGIENDGKPCITIEGTVDKRSVVVLIYAEPFDDADDEDVE